MFDVLRSPMHAAAVRGRAEIMQLLLSTGVLGLELGTGAESYLKRVASSVRETPEGACREHWTCDMSEKDNHWDNLVYEKQILIGHNWLQTLDFVFYVL